MSRGQQQQEQKQKQNLWNQCLSEQSSNTQGFTNKNLLILGRKYAGKRTLIDQLIEISKTTYPKRDPKDNQGGKLRIKGSSALLDYTYLNVTDLKDQDNSTNARLNVYLFEEDFQLNLLNLVLNENSLNNTFVVIALDLQEPWKFMDDLNRWIDALTQAVGNVSKKLNLQTVDGMKRKIEDYVRNFKDYGDETDQPKQKEQDIRDQKNIQIPLREGVLKSNIGLPIMVVVTKSDIIEQVEKEKDWDAKFEVIRYVLRQFCITYGATLLFTSSKQNININIFYEYILHRLYGFTLKHNSDQNNGESLFIPAGYDDSSILKSLFTKFTGQVIYEERVPMPLSKKGIKEEIVVEDNQEFFKKLKEKQGVSSSTKPQLTLSQNLSQATLEPKQEDKSQSIAQAAPGQQKQNQQLANFYSKMLKPEQQQQQLKESAQLELFSKIKGSTKNEPVKIDQSNNLEKNKISNLLKQQSVVNTIDNLNQSPQKAQEGDNNRIRNILMQNKPQNKE